MLGTTYQGHCLGLSLTWLRDGIHDTRHVWQFVDCGRGMMLQLQTASNGNYAMRKNRRADNHERTGLA